VKRTARAVRANRKSVKELRLNGGDQIRRTIASGEKAVGLAVSKTVISDAGRTWMAAAAGADGAGCCGVGGVGVEDRTQHSGSAAVIFTAG